MELFKQVYQQADYVAINISSPNTLNLRQLQARDFIEGLLKEVTLVRDECRITRTSVPVLVKIAPDLTEAEIDDVLGAIELAGVDGIIATNTTIGREGIPAQYRDLKGGLSGRPLTQRSTDVIRCIARKTNGRLPIIGVGGVMNPLRCAGKVRGRCDVGASLHRPRVCRAGFGQADQSGVGEA